MKIKFVDTIINHINNYKTNLNINCIHNVQWMLRYNLADEKGSRNFRKILMY